MSNKKSELPTIIYTTTDGQITTPSVGNTTSYIVSNTYDEVGKMVWAKGLNMLEVNQFKSNKTLKTIKLPNSIDQVNESSFADCTALESIEFGNGEITFGQYILNNCISLKKIVFHGSINQASSVIVFSGINSSGISVYYPTEDAIYITKVIDHLDKPATADVNNFFPVTLVNDTTTEIAKELYEKYKDYPLGASIDFDGPVEISGYTLSGVLKTVNAIQTTSAPIFTISSDGSVSANEPL